jgi:hypothetical protein
MPNLLTVPELEEFATSSLMALMVQDHVLGPLMRRAVYGCRGDKLERRQKLGPQERAVFLSEFGCYFASGLLSDATTETVVGQVATIRNGIARDVRHLLDRTGDSIEWTLAFIGEEKRFLQVKTNDGEYVLRCIVAMLPKVRMACLSLQVKDA